MKIIHLTRGYITVVDDKDFLRFGHLNWRAHSNQNGHICAARTVRVNGRNTAVLMHREILGATGTELVDHRDLDPLNNRRRNLRRCNKSGNSSNRGPSATNKSGFKGVSWRSDGGKWVAQIKCKKVIYLGLFVDPVEAAKAYDRAAVKYFGEFARLNFPA